MNRELLTTFLTTVELGSFSLAAEALHLAQSSVSRQIAVLERELEAPLFERQGRLRLTPAGERLTVLAHRYLSLRQRLAEECRSADAGLQPLTVFACSPGCSLLEPLLEELTGERPIILLDDVLSELDTGRREWLLGGIGQNQVFLTCCDPAGLEGLEHGQFHIHNGCLVD